MAGSDLVALHLTSGGVRTTQLPGPRRVTSDEPWVPAVQYLATLGFFDGYDARPHEPLGVTAGNWTERWRRLSRNATRLDAGLSRADAAVAIYRDLTRSFSQG